MQACRLLVGHARLMPTNSPKAKVGKDDVCEDDAVVGYLPRAEDGGEVRSPWGEWSLSVREDGIARRLVCAATAVGAC